MVQVQKSVDSIPFAFVSQASVLMSTMFRKSAVSEKSAAQYHREGKLLGL